VSNYLSSSPLLISFLCNSVSAFSDAFLSRLAASPFSGVACCSRWWIMIWRSYSLSAFQMASLASHLYSRFFQSCSLPKHYWTWSFSTVIWELRALIRASFRSDWFILPSLICFSSAFLSLWMREAISDFNLFNSSSSPFSRACLRFFLTSCSIRALTSWSGLVLRALWSLEVSPKLSIMNEFSEGWSESDYCLRFDFW